MLVRFRNRAQRVASKASVTLCLVGDVMLGRGIDQVLPHPGPPEIWEAFSRSAHDYVVLAERINGAITKPVAYPYVWGDALSVLRGDRCSARIINLETSITHSEDYAPKGINYRMNPDNVGCLQAAAIDCCVLANNHSLDFGVDGLLETLEVLEKARIQVAGAGYDTASASAPAIFPLPEGPRLLVFAFGCPSSGIPPSWAARVKRPGVNLLPDLSARAAAELAKIVRSVRLPSDLLVASIHWGGNWGYEISEQQSRFARWLIDDPGFHIVYGHSSHHPKALELHHGGLIIYGCGDFINDYEGIPGYEAFRSDLVLMYLPRLQVQTGRFVDMEMIPYRISRFRLQRASDDEAAWLARTIKGVTCPDRIRISGNGSLLLYP